MKNIFRALRLAMNYKYSLALSILCSTIVAVFWASNITVVYPFVEVIFKGQTLQTYIDGEITALKERKREIESVFIASDERDAHSMLALAVEKQRLESIEAELAKKERYRVWIYRYAPTDTFHTLAYIVSFLLIGTAIKCVFRIVGAVLVARVGNRTAADIRREFFRAKLSDRVGMADKVGDAAGRVSGDVGAIGAAIEMIFGRSIQEPMKMMGCLAAAAYVNWRLLLFSLLICPVASFLLIGLARSIRRASHRSFDQTCLLISRMLQTFRGIEVVKAYNMESHERRQFWEHTLKVYREQIKIAFYGSLVRANNELLGVGVLCLSVLAGGHLVLGEQTRLFGIPLADHPMDFGEIMLFFAFLIGCTDPLRKLADVYGTIQGGVAAADRMMPIIDAMHHHDEHLIPYQPMVSAKQDLVFDNVHFHYHPDKPVLEGVSFRVSHGETLAVVGPNGCGKSTLIKLLLRFHDPTGGRILLGDTDIKHLRPRDLRRRTALVTQRPVLFDDSVSNNIRYGSRDASQIEIVSAAQKAHAHEFIVSALPYGYNTFCGEFGGHLSGGQQQRISLARAILRDPDILILDEAASQIDPKSEELIHQSLKEFARGRTTIMITHRMSTLALADRILMLEAGHVVDIGTHAELIDRCARYRVLRQNPQRKSA
jgi:ATP-binding cassette subfamily B protein/subfamily B ATP-binding cassette protein MsbA